MHNERDIDVYSLRHFLEIPLLISGKSTRPERLDVECVICVKINQIPKQSRW